MNEDLRVQAVIEEFVVKAKEKYEVITTSDQIQALLSLAQDQMTEFGILRLKRFANTQNNWKTLAINLVEDPAAFDLAFNWVAAVKDELPDPESADLYFIGVVRGGVISQELCTNIESGEQFCRKYILRPDETLNDLLERTFLASSSGGEVEAEIVDPLYMAIQQTATRMPTFTGQQQAYWREVLLSGNSGAELIDHLFKQLPILLKETDNETPGENNAQ